MTNTQIFRPVSLNSDIQNRRLDECSKELAFIGEQARRMKKLTCPRCGSMDINVSMHEPKEFRFCHDCSIMRIPEPVVDDNVDNKNEKKSNID